MSDFAKTRCDADFFAVLGRCGSLARNPKPRMVSFAATFGPLPDGAAAFLPSVGAGG